MAHLANKFGDAGVSDKIQAGMIIAWDKNITGVPALNTNEWEECNTGSVSAPGPINGQTKPPINSSNYFVRANATSGGTTVINEGTGRTFPYRDMVFIIAVKDDVDIPVGGIVPMKTTGTLSSGTLTGSTNDKLTDSGADFTGDGVEEGHIAFLTISNRTGDVTASNNTQTVRTMTFSPAISVHQVIMNIASTNDGSNQARCRWTYEDLSTNVTGFGNSVGDKTAFNPEPDKRVTTLKFEVQSFASLFNIRGRNAGVNAFADAAVVTAVDSGTVLSVSRDIFQSSAYDYEIGKVKYPGEKYILSDGETINDSESPMDTEDTNNCVGHLLRGNTTSGGAGTIDMDGSPATYTLTDVIPYIKIKE